LAQNQKNLKLVLSGVQSSRKHTNDITRMASFVVSNYPSLLQRWSASVICPSHLANHILFRVM